jgi:radial spoke head protein 1
VFNETAMRFTGEWHENKLIRGKWVFPNGNFYEGEFENNRPAGHGQWHFKNGNVVEGSYHQLVVPNDDGKLTVRLDWH